MSLISLIRNDKEIRDFLYSTMPTEYESHSARKEPVMITGDASLIGSVTDFAFRVEAAKCAGIAVNYQIVERGIKRINSDSEQLRQSYENVKKFVDDYLESYTVATAADLITVIPPYSAYLWLANMETAARGIRATRWQLTEEELQACHSLLHGFRLVFLDGGLISGDTYLAPVFGEWSLRAGGAEADLITGRTLYDFKNTTRIGSSRDKAQVWGYYLLSRLSGMYQVDRIGLYYSRTGTLMTAEAAADKSVLEEFGRLIAVHGCQ